MIEPASAAAELLAAYEARRPMTPLSSRDPSFDLERAYSIEREFVRRRRAAGHETAGLKVGYASKAVWRALKLKTLVWAHMYDDTVRLAEANQASLSVSHMTSPKIEPEIVFKLRSAVHAGAADAAAALAAVEWIALGFEIIDSVYPDWKFRPEDFVAAFGLHRALVVGSPLGLDERNRAALAEALPAFTVSLSRDGETIASGSGKNSLGSPAACLVELASAVAASPDVASLGRGSLVSSGTLTESQPMGSDQTWRAEISGLDLPPLTLRSAA